MAAEFAVDDVRKALESARDIVDGPDLKFPVETRFSRGGRGRNRARYRRSRLRSLVMGMHGRTGLGRLLLGNTAESVLTKADRPVIIVKGPQAVSHTTSGSAGADGRSSPSDLRFLNFLQSLTPRSTYR